jgi:hypothetical protein
MDGMGTVTIMKAMTTTWKKKKTWKTWESITPSTSEKPPLRRHQQPEEQEEPCSSSFHRQRWPTPLVVAVLGLTVAPSSRRK